MGELIRFFRNFFSGTTDAEISLVGRYRDAEEELNKTQRELKKVKDELDRYSRQIDPEALDQESLKGGLGCLAVAVSFLIAGSIFGTIYENVPEGVKTFMELNSLCCVYFPAGLVAGSLVVKNWKYIQYFLTGDRTINRIDEKYRKER